jgi:hypothetical protein
MSTTMLTKVTINSIDVTANLLTWATKEKFNQEITTCEINLSKNVFDLVSDLGIGQSILIQRGETTSTDTTIFDGIIDVVEKNGAVIKVKGKDQLVTLLRTQVNKTYDINISSQAGVGSAIAQDLIETEGGMTATVVTTPSGLTIKKFILNNTSILESLQKLATVYDYIVFYDSADGTVHFEPKGLLESSTTLLVGDNVTNLPEWITDDSQTINKLKVLGAEQIIETVETFDGTGLANQQNVLTNKPIGVKAVVDGSEKRAGIASVTTGTYDYEIDKENKFIDWNQVFAPSSDTGNIVITSTFAKPIPIIITNDESIALYGLHEGSRHFSNIQTADDAESAGDGFLIKFGTPFISTKLDVVDVFDFDVGNRVRVIDTQQNEDRWIIINEVVRKYPYKSDTLLVGDKEWRLADWGQMTMERIKRLEELTAQNEDLVIEVKNFPKALIVSRKYLQALSKDVSGDSMIYLNPTLGIWNDKKWGDGAGIPEVVVRTIWQNQKVIEPFVNTEFKDTVNTTATWSGTGSATFTNGEIAQSEIIYDNAVNLTSALLTADNTTNMTFELQVDGINWETVTSGVALTFANVGQELKFRVTASGNATLNNLTIEVIE